jgi:hypothetical protein
MNWSSTPMPAPGLDEARDALVDTDAVGICKAQRSVRVNVDIHPQHRDSGLTRR